MSETEIGACDFCGGRTTVAVSEQGPRVARICRACAQWADDTLAGPAPCPACSGALGAKHRGCAK